MRLAFLLDRRWHMATLIGKLKMFTILNAEVQVMMSLTLRGLRPDMLCFCCAVHVFVWWTCIYRAWDVSHVSVYWMYVWVIIVQIYVCLSHTFVYREYYTRVHVIASLRVCFFCVYIMCMILHVYTYAQVSHFTDRVHLFILCWVILYPMQSYAILNCQSQNVIYLVILLCNMQYWSIVDL